MAAVYQSPGVYVEEVPSTQQPIAGVGTNTVAFIGIVPDVIDYPIPNEEYDPDEAEKAAAGPEQHQDEINKLEAELKDLQDKKKQEQEAVAEADNELKKPDITGPNRNKFSKRKDDAEAEIRAIDQQIKDKQKSVGELRKPKQVDAKLMRPYLLQKFDVTAQAGIPILCTNFSEYRDRFGTFSTDDPDNPGEAKYPEHRALTHAVYGFFQNGGTRCFVARVERAADVPRTLENFESIDAVAIVAVPGMCDRGTWQAVVGHCNKCEDRFAIFDCPAEVGAGGELDIQKLTYDTPDNVLPQRNKNAAFYFPYIWVIDSAKRLQDEDPARRVPLKHRGSILVPPSGHVAGIYARTDEQRGVHKAPANAAIVGAVGVKYYIGKPKQGLLNPQGVNVIRDLNGNITVWGARTIGGDKNAEWKYVSVRRLFLFLKESIDEGTQWVVFEPNDRLLWGKIRRNVGAFLTVVWRSGALFGSTPQEAFYVKCDDETNPLEVRELGQVVTEIGVSIVRPAEFVIFRITQSAGERT